MTVGGTPNDPPFLLLCCRWWRPPLLHGWPGAWPMSTPADRGQVFSGLLVLSSVTSQSDLIPTSLHYYFFLFLKFIKLFISPWNFVLPYLIRGTVAASCVVVCFLVRFSFLHTCLPLWLYCICSGKSSKSVGCYGNMDCLSRVPNSLIQTYTAFPIFPESS